MSNQIQLLHEQGLKPEEIAEGLDMPASEVVFQLFQMGLLGGIKNTSVKVGEDPIDEPVSVFEKYKEAIHERLVGIALSETENVGAAVKACMYLNEEITGRNERRIKENVTNNTFNISVLRQELEDSRKKLENNGNIIELTEKAS